VSTGACGLHRLLQHAGRAGHGRRPGWRRKALILPRQRVGKPARDSPENRARYTFLMRLTEDEQRDIAAAACAVLPRGSRVSLFGSRTDDSKRGGDVDLLVEVSSALTVDEIVRSRALLTVQLYRRMGERRIDILMCQLDRPDPRPVVAEARRNGIELARV
jgi:predicted nucleotidyltransferase